MQSSIQIGCFGSLPEWSLRTAYGFTKRHTLREILDVLATANADIAIDARFQMLYQTATH